MDIHSLAKQLDGIEYPPRISKWLVQEAKDAGLVIVYGASDDLMEFEGAIYDEFGCYGGDTVMLDSKGLLVREHINDDDDNSVADYVARTKQARSIESLWCKEPGLSWSYKTDIPHACFNVMEDGEIYCRGIVFSLSSLDMPEQSQAAEVTVASWSEADVREFLSVALRHSDGLKGELHFQDVNDALRYMAERGKPAYVQAATAGTEQVLDALGRDIHSGNIAPIPVELFDKANAIREKAEANRRREADHDRIDVCLKACEDIPTDKLRGKTIAEYVADEAFLVGMTPAEEGGMDIGIKGLATQMLAASFAGQFVGNQAVNFLEIRMTHDELGPFVVTIQRVAGKTPGALRAEALVQRDALLTALQSALQTARFERHPFRSWHAEAESAISLVTGSTEIARER